MIRTVEQLREINHKLIVAAVEANSGVDYGYSGRGMYGTHCVAIEGDLVDILMAVGKQGLPRPKLDAMGMDSVVYWPDIKTDGEKIIFD